jgi:hypothetical protein
VTPLRGLAEGTPEHHLCVPDRLRRGRMLLASADPVRRHRVAAPLDVLRRQPVE